jgi:hypothetical protein
MLLLSERAGSKGQSTIVSTPAIMLNTVMETAKVAVVWGAEQRLVITTGN